MVLFGVVRSVGAVIAPLVILFVSLWVIRIPFAKALIPQLGADAIWWSFPLGSVIACGMALGYYWLGTWRKAHMMSADPAAETALTPEAATVEASSPTHPEAV